MTFDNDWDGANMAIQHNNHSIHENDDDCCLSFFDNLFDVFPGRAISVPSTHGECLEAVVDGTHRVRLGG